MLFLFCFAKSRPDDHTAYGNNKAIVITQSEVGTFGFSIKLAIVGFLFTRIKYSPHKYTNNWNNLTNSRDRTRFHVLSDICVATSKTLHVWVFAVSSKCARCTDQIHICYATCIQDFGIWFEILLKKTFKNGKLYIRSALIFFFNFYFICFKEN